MPCCSDYPDKGRAWPQAYHKGFDIESTKHVTDMDPAKISKTLSEAAQAKIISTRIRVARNLSMFPLNPGADKETRGKICDMMEKVYAGIDGELVCCRRRRPPSNPHFSLSRRACPGWRYVPAHDNVRRAAAGAHR